MIRVLLLIKVMDYMKDNKEMEIIERIQSREDVKAISIRLLGDYQSVNYMEAWNKLGAYCQKHNIDYDCPDAECINIYHDNPAITPAEACRTDVCIAAPVVEQLLPEEDVDIITIYGGCFLVYRYQGGRMRNWRKLTPKFEVNSFLHLARG